MSRWGKSRQDPRMTAEQGTAQLKSLLYSCRPEQLSTYTVEQLTRMYRVDTRVAEYELTIARQKRAAA